MESSDATEPRNPSVTATCGLLIALVAIGDAGFLWARYTGHPQLAHSALIFASTSFVALVLATGATRCWYGRLILLGLVLCWLGDCLGPYDLMASASAFLWGHSAFMAAFAVRGVRPRRLLVALLVTVLATGIALRWIYPYVPRDDYLPVFSYLFAFTLMLVFAGGSRPGPAFPLIIIGSVLFYLGDLFFALDEYIRPAFVNVAASFSLYYASCILFALTPLVHKKETRRRETPNDHAARVSRAEGVG